MTYPLSTFPWIDRQEVREVFAGLYSHDISRQKFAVDRVHVWESRSLSRLPLAAESTAALVKADVKFNEATEPVSHSIRIREQYSMAIIRFVNLFTERNQQKAHALPVHVVASRLGVPSWIVDLRHAATHDNLPSLAELRAAANWCLQWLKTEFWEVQCEDTTVAVNMKLNSLQMLRDHLVTYMQRQFSGLSNDEPVPLKNLLVKIEGLLTENGIESCPVVLEDGYFIFTEEQLVSIGVDKEDITNDQCSNLPFKIVEFWTPLLQLLAKCKLLPGLLFHIVTAVGNFCTVRNSFLCKWFHTIINCGNANKKTHLFAAAPDIPFKTLLIMCLQAESDTLDSCINILIQKVKLPKLALKRLSSLKSIFASDIPGEVCEEGVYSVQDIFEDNCTADWKRCSENIEWSRLPLGVLPNQDTRYLSLELNSDFDEDIPVDEEKIDDQMEDLEEDIHCSDNVFISYDNPGVPCAWDNSSVEKLNEEMFVF